LRFATDLADALGKAGFVQESAFENLGAKQTPLAGVDRLRATGVLISSSGADFLAKELQQHCAHPERIIVGHPFHPPYLIPLVEIVGGEDASPPAVSRQGRGLARWCRSPLPHARNLRRSRSGSP
jgi:carnitine 3-dehydrogenase